MSSPVAPTSAVSIVPVNPDCDRTPFVALNPEPAIALTKSAILSFLFAFESPASIIAMLSFATSTVAAVKLFKSKSIV